MSKHVSVKRPQSLNDNRAKFLAHLRRTGNITESARKVGVDKRTVFRMKERDPAFAADILDAQSEAADLLESVARGRAVDGVKEPVFHQGEVCGHVVRYSDRLLELLLKANNPDKFREKGPLINLDLRQIPDGDLDERIAGIISKIGIDALVGGKGAQEGKAQDPSVLSGGGYLEPVQLSQTHGVLQSRKDLSGAINAGGESDW